MLVAPTYTNMQRKPMSPPNTLILIFFILVNYLHTYIHLYYALMTSVNTFVIFAYKKTYSQLSCLSSTPQIQIVSCTITLRIEQLRIYLCMSFDDEFMRNMSQYSETIFLYIKNCRSLLNFQLQRNYTDLIITFLNVLYMVYVKQLYLLSFRFIIK